MKRLLWLMVSVSLFVSLFVGCAKVEEKPVEVISRPTAVEALPEVSSDYGISVAVIYDSTIDSIRWQDTMDLLEQSILLGIRAEAIDVSGEYDLSGFDVVIPDAELTQSAYMDMLSADLVAYTEQGGFVLLDNSFAQIMPMDYLGISEVKKLAGCPLDMTYPEVGADLGQIQQVVADFAALYPEYYEAEILLKQDYGCGFVSDTAVSMADWNGLAIYTFHKYGNGGVMLTNPLLPNIFSLGNYAMTHREEGETAFASTTASCNQLLLSRFAAYAAKQKYGYALNRVYGYYGSPSMAWELHYEEITAYANNAMKVFDDICRAYQQIPSYTIIRNSYWWFLRAESINYLKNQSADGFDFSMDFEESAYSSGTHIVSDGQWLSLGKIEDAGSYFREYPEYNYRAYPCFADVDGDGEVELLSGSYDGCIYVYDDLNYSDRLHVSAAQKLDGVQVSGFSAPQMMDLNGDGRLDLLTGSADGNIYWFVSSDNGYVNQGVLLYTDIPGQSLPAVGDLNGDGITDLAVGSDQGVLLVYYGQQTNAGIAFNWRSMESYSKLCTNEGYGKFLAPAVVDWNKDGLLDLAVGTFDGYIALLLNSVNGEMIHHGYIELNEMNYKGNARDKFGNYCVPAFFDVDGDDAEDLVCGSLEYGLAYPIDSEYFPYRGELQAQFDYARENYQYLGIHHYSNAYASREREDYELRRHKEAFADFGVKTEGIGANMHTWYTSTLGDTLTFDAEFDAGLLWNSGFSSPGDPGAAPQYAAENVIALPFFLQREGKDTLLVQNNSVFLYADTVWSDISAKYDMPICLYYHCDFCYENDAGARDFVQKAFNFQHQNGYNFLREDQMMKASAASRNLDVFVENQNGVLTLTPATLSQDGVLYNDDVQNALGIEMEFAENVDTNSYSVNAKVWHREDNSLFFSLDDGVTVSQMEADASPLRQVNLPADITVSEGAAEIAFLDTGMQQVMTEPGYTTDSADWIITERETYTVFTHYGEAVTLQLRKIEE